VREIVEAIAAGQVVTRLVLSPEELARG
jgi:hypothetical protein